MVWLCQTYTLLNWSSEAGNSERSLAFVVVAYCTGWYKDDYKFTSYLQSFKWFDFWAKILSKLLFNSLRASDTYMRHRSKPSLFQIMVCWLTGSKPLSDWMECWDIVNWALQWNPNRNPNSFFHENAFGNVVWKKTGGHFMAASMC